MNLLKSKWAEVFLHLGFTVAFLVVVILLCCTVPNLRDWTDESWIVTALGKTLLGRRDW